MQNNIFPSRDVIWINKNYGEYLSGQEHTKVESYILQGEYESDKWTRVKI